MKRGLAIILLLLCGGWVFAQDSIPPRSTKSYLTADYIDKDTAFLREKCRQANLALGFSVLAIKQRPRTHIFLNQVRSAQGKEAIALFDVSIGFFEPIVRNGGDNLFLMAFNLF